MLQQVTMTIDGAPVRAPKGAPVLEVALEYAICIPHLCHVPNLTAFGGCRLCIVEVVEGDRARVTTSCTLDAREGLVVRANSERVRRLRRNIAELLVAEAPNSRALQDVAVRCGVTQVRYPFRRKDCILCGRCVRLCAEQWQAHAIGFVGRGQDRRVEYPLGVRPDSCKRRHACVEICPMTITPCGGPMEPGEERLCGQCESQLTMERDMPGVCIQCELGKGFHCLRAAV
jgi:NADH dehydrogenase/NADH:ubiquinone oxidoreductase subunit G